MKVYNKEKTEILEYYNLKLGYLKEDTITKKVENMGYSEKIIFDENHNIIGSVPNEEFNSKDFLEIQEKIQVYIPYSSEEIEFMKHKKLIAEKKAFLDETDYVAIKIAEKKIIGEDVSTLLCEYKDILEKRDKARNIINNSENIINKLSK